MDFNRKSFSVSELNTYVKGVLLNDVILNDIYIVGEVVGLKEHFSGHLYFQVKDIDSAINCVMFKFNASLMPMKIENGMKVLIHGSVTIYEKTGSFQIVCKEMKPFGVGDLQIKIDLLKKKLSTEGFFDLSLKKKIPTFPKNVAIITSDTGAVLHDILNISSRRNKNIKVYVYHSQVQGEKAHIEISKAIDEVGKLDYIDVIILARGGGSFLDLLPFNDEMVARSIFNCKIPLVSAVGHETDYTIADMVADKRCATPSEAAEVVFYDENELKEELYRYSNYLHSLILQKYKANLSELESIKNLKVFANPTVLIEKEKSALLLAKDKMSQNIKNTLEKDKNKLLFSARILEANSPINNFVKGYSLTKTEDGNLLKSIKKLNEGDTIVTTLSDGIVTSRVSKVENNS